MSWVEVQKAINSDLDKPLNELIQEIDKYLYHPKGELQIFAGKNTEVNATNLVIGKEINTSTDKFGFLQLELIYGDWAIEIVGDQTYNIVIRDVPVIIENGDKLTLQTATWPEIDEMGKLGIAQKLFEIGDTKVSPFDSGTSREFTLVGIEHDDLSAGGKAALTFMAKLLIGTAAMNGGNTNTTGWTTSAMRSTTLTNMYNGLPQELKDVIKEVNKKTSAGNNQATIVTTQDKLWLASEMELFGVITGSFAGEGKHYPFFADASTRTRTNNWWTRSPYTNTTNFVLVNTIGSADSDSARNSYGVVPGFCI